MRWKKKQMLPAMLAALVLQILLSTFAAASGGTGTVVWSTVQGRTATVYLPASGEIASVTGQIGTVKCEQATQTPISQQNPPIETIFLLDNSRSIPSESRTKISSLMLDMIGGRMSNEQFTIATVSEGLNYLCQGESDYTALKEFVNGLQYNNQDTYLNDIVYELLEGLVQKKETGLKRIVIFADGANNKEIGYTKEEVHEKIKSAGYPIYVVGCRNKTPENNTELENLFAFSRLTAGKSFLLDEVQDMSGLIKELTALNTAVRVDVEIPAQACDGSTKGLLLTVQQADGNSIEYTTQIAAPFAEATAAPTPTAATPTPAATAAPTPEPTPVPTPEPEPEPGFPIWGIALIAVAAVAVIAAVVLLTLRARKKKQNQFEPDPSQDTGGDGSTEMLDPTMQVDSKTAMIWNQPKEMMLVLTDIENETRRFEVPLRGNVAIGRDASKCQVVIEHEPSISHHQCDIFLQSGSVMVINRSSSNITTLNGQSLTTAREIRNGSLLKMGRVTFKVEIK